MKKNIIPLIIAVSFLIPTVHTRAQDTSAAYPFPENGVSVSSSNIQTLSVPYNATTHIISPEPILYVDISTPAVEGDMPEKNIFRLKPDTTKISAADSFTVTVVTAAYIAVYRLGFTGKEKKYVFTVDPNRCVALDQGGLLTMRQCHDLVLQAMKKKRRVFDVQAKAYGQSLWVNNIFVVGGYLFLDIGGKNSSNLPYTVDRLRFKLRDRSQVAATVSQETEQEPFYQFYPTDGTVLSGQWRNYFILKKFTYPTQKLFTLELTESQVSGRKITLNLDYDQILDAQKL